MRSSERGPLPPRGDDGECKQNPANVPDRLPLRHTDNNVGLAGLEDTEAFLACDLAATAAGPKADTSGAQIVVRLNLQRIGDR